MHRRVEDPDAGHDLVPVQVGSLQVSEHPGFADVAQSAVKDAPVIEDHHIAWKRNKRSKKQKGRPKAQASHLICRAVQQEVLLQGALWSGASPTRLDPSCR